MHSSHHARVRCQQRGIPPLVVDLLLEFGSREQAGAGTSKVFLDKSARRRVKAYAGALAGVIEEHLDVYLVVNDADDVLVTATHRLERIRRH
jgi:hypothetical protein